MAGEMRIKKVQAQVVRLTMGSLIAKAENNVILWQEESHSLNTWKTIMTGEGEWISIAKAEFTDIPIAPSLFRRQLLIADSAFP
jgi:hypothetical protein